jgi:hypothetical protein
MRINIIILLFFPFYSFSQNVFDNFSDGNFTQNPTWTGTTTDFIINANEQLQLNNTVAGSSYLATEIPSVTGELEWQVWLRLNFSPSANNMSKIYLSSNQSKLDDPLNGYYLKIGENGSNDPVELYRQDGTNSILLLRGTEGFVANSFSIRIKIIRSTNGQWELYADALGGMNFILQGTVTDNVHSIKDYLGVYCLYTLSNANKFFFDDFYFGPKIIDNSPPLVENIIVESKTEISIVFSEGVSLSSSENLSNYTANNGIGNPNAASRNLTNPALVKLTFSSPFSDGVVNQLNVKNIQDFSGNTILTASHDFLFYEVKQFDVVFNELLVDPSPSVGLPEFEYIELMNTTALPINIKNWILTCGNTSRILPEVEIQPLDYLLLCAPAALSELIQFGNVVAVNGLSSTALTNAGTNLMLQNDQGKTIHSLVYDESWYQNNEKKDGGWSMEQIDQNNPCGGKKNWKASIDLKGGTPGKKNSVFGQNADLISPSITGTCFLDNNLLEVFFSEPVSGVDLTVTTNYVINHGIGSPLTVVLGNDKSNSIILSFAEKFEDKLVYNLTVTGDIHDCSGNIMKPESVKFSLKKADFLDLVINEIMMKPDPVVGLPNEEYIELYNRTDYPINLKDWSITIGTNSAKSFPCMHIQPKGYLIVCNSNSVDYFSNYGVVAGIPGLNALVNAGGSIKITNAEGEQISAVEYKDSWYRSSQKKAGGWSLEQIDPENPCAGNENWGESIDVKGGTPGQKNSIKSEMADKKAPVLKRVSIIDEFSIRLFFDEALHPKTTLDLEAFTIDQNIGKPISAELMEPANVEIVLTLDRAIKSGLIYTITLNPKITDCVGNVINPMENTARFALAAPCEMYDLVINEVLFNPHEGGVDFVELYNRSNKVLDLKDLRISSFDMGKNELSSVKEIAKSGYLLFPGEFVVLTTNPDIVKNHYRVSTKNFKQMESLPSFANTKGNVVISKKDNLIIDEFEYSDQMHFPLLRNVKGVSLERIDTERVATDATNWISAAENVGYATPGYKNSQFNRSTPAVDLIQIEPKVFSPDNDGYHDVLNISYRLNNSGFVGNITIFDGAGRIIRSLMQNKLLGSEGTISWDGINDNREKASIGIYVIYAEFFDLQGNVKKDRKTCVLGTRF